MSIHGCGAGPRILVRPAQLCRGAGSAVESVAAVVRRVGCDSDLWFPMQRGCHPGRSDALCIAKSRDPSGCEAMDPGYALRAFRDDSAVIHLLETRHEAERTRSYASGGQSLPR